MSQIYRQILEQTLEDGESNNSEINKLKERMNEMEQHYKNVVEEMQEKCDDLQESVDEMNEKIETVKKITKDLYFYADDKKYYGEVVDKIKQLENIKSSIGDLCDVMFYCEHNVLL
tara:strand:+ start:224 stop:571 length:348 start_codon:yes stop_codon:yes gene_type:complete